MSRTISGTTFSAITLGEYDSPVTITQNGFVFPASGGTYALTGPSGTRFTIRNSGTLNGLTGGIRLFSGGTITNNTIGTISGPVDGIRIYSGPATITNFGTITGGSYFGVALTLTSAGSVSNQLNASITALKAGVYATGTTASVYNAGTIAGSANLGVQLRKGGGVSNTSTGMISGGETGVVVDGGAGTVFNAGGITGTTADGVKLLAGRVGNDSSGVLHGAVAGVRIVSADFGDYTGATLTNQGVISGGADNPANAARRAGVYAAVWGDVIVTNSATGTITSGRDGLFVARDRTLTLSNAGRIVGSANYGVYSYARGTVTNLATGTITGGKAGVYLRHQGNTVDNSGSIGGAGQSGVALQFGGVVGNAASGRITGGAFGVHVYSRQATVTNAGAISGSSNEGIALLASGSVTNAATGTISGGADGILITGSLGLGTVLNSGGIVGKAIGVELYNHGPIDGSAATVSNAATGEIIGGADGVVIRVSYGSVTNDGMIAGKGVNNTGVRFDEFGGSVSNQGTGAILGGDIGVYSGGAANLSNAGSIEGIYGYGVNFKSGGAVSNLSSGQIGGLTRGILIRNAAGYVSNAGRIRSGAIAVQLNAGGAITNTGTGLIGGLFGGVYGFNGTGTVVNAGTLAGNARAAVYLEAGFANRVIASPGAVFQGSVDGGNSIGATVSSVLELASGASTGVLSGLGSQFTHFSQMVVDTGANWMLVGGNTPQGITVTNAGTLSVIGDLTDTTAPVVNNGLMRLSGGTVALGSLSGTGTVTVGAGAYLTVDTTVPGSETIILEAGARMRVNGTVTNAGIINGAGLHVGADQVANLGSGNIHGGGYAVVADLRATVTNAGTLSGLNGGITLKAGGDIANAADGSISGVSAPGVLVAGAAGTVTNAGTIAGAVAAVQLPAGFANVLIDIPGAVFNGTVDGGNTIGATISSTLKLTSAASVGTLTGLGTRFIDFAEVVVDAGASWALRGNSTLAAGTTLTNAGTLILGGGGLADAGSVINNGTILDSALNSSLAALTGNGRVLIGATRTLTLTGTVSSTETIAFTGVGLLALAPDTFSGVISGLASGGGITLSGVTDATVAGIINTNTLAVLRSGHGQINLTLDPGQSYAGLVFPVVAGGGIAPINLATLTGPTTIANGQVEALTGAAASSLAAVNGGAGGIVVSGAGSRLTTGLAPLAGNFAVGDTVVGHLAITTGGLVTSTTDAIVADGAGGSGSSVSVTGAGSNWRITGALSVGQGGAGALSVGAGATVTTTDFVTIGRFTGDGSSVNVSGGGASLRAGDQLYAGVFGTGAPSVESGATVTVPTFVAGDSASAVGHVNLNGVGSSLVIGGLAEVANAGQAGTSVRNGATFSAGALIVGAQAGGSGAIEVSGAGSSVLVAGDAVVANDGAGVLSVLNGATVSATNLTVGNLGDSFGALVVSGKGSVINVTGALNIGTALGIGDLTVGPGAAVHASVVNLLGHVVLEGGLLDPTVNLIGQGQTVGGSGTIAADEIVAEGVIQAGNSQPSQKLLVVDGVVSGGGTLTINGTVQPSNPAAVLRINAGGTMELTGAVLNGTTTFIDDLATPNTYTVANSVVDVTFEDATGVLVLDSIAGFAGTIATYHAGDAFVITGGTLSGLGVENGTTLMVQDSGPGAGAGGVDRIMFAQAIDPATLTIRDGNTIVACFAEGTRIRTATGPMAVEHLRVGDLVLTADGAAEPIVWLGRRTVDCARHATPEAVRPVRVAAHAFDFGKPGRDLYLSPDHAVFVDGALVPVRLLVNGTTITQVERRSVTYYHVELPCHAVILADGLEVESYLDVGDRRNFAGETVVRLMPDFGTRLTADVAWAWETRGAAPLVLGGEDLARVRAAISGGRRECGAAADRTRPAPASGTRVD